MKYYGVRFKDQQTNKWIGTLHKCPSDVYLMSGHITICYYAFQSKEKAIYEANEILSGYYKDKKYEAYLYSIDEEKLNKICQAALWQSGSYCWENIERRLHYIYLLKTLIEGTDSTNKTSNELDFTMRAEGLLRYYELFEMEYTKIKMK